MEHKCTFTKGTDARNHIARCECGWSFSGTYLAIRARARLHGQVFFDETRSWRDSRREALMPATAAMS